MIIETILKINPKAIVNVIGNDISEVRIFEFIDGYSTTKTIKNISNR